MSFLVNASQSAALVMANYMQQLQDAYSCYGVHCKERSCPAAGHAETPPHSTKHNNSSGSSLQPTMCCRHSCPEATQQCRGGNQQVLWGLMHWGPGTAAQHAGKVLPGQASQVRHAIECAHQPAACGTAWQSWSDTLPRCCQHSLAVSHTAVL